MKKKTGARSAMAELLSKGNETLEKDSILRNSGVKEIIIRQPNSPTGNIMKMPIKRKTALKKRKQKENVRIAAASTENAAKTAKSSLRKKKKAFDLHKPIIIISVIVVSVGVMVAAVFLVLAKINAKLSPDAYLGAVPEKVNSLSFSSQVLRLGKAEDKITASQDRFSVTFDIFGDKTVVCSTSRQTVGKLLSDMNITVGDDQILRADPADSISTDIVIPIDKITYGTVSEEKPVSYETEYINIQTIPRGTTKLKQSGVNGKKTVEYAVTYINDVESERVQSNEYITVNPTTQLLYKGVGGTVKIGGTAHSFSYYIDCATTVYTGGGTTATGVPASESVIAVDPNVIPLGSKCYVADPHCYVGIRTAADTGGSIKGNFIDIYFNPSNPSLSGYGRRSARVYILG